jgi:hypothetical protein
MGILTFIPSGSGIDAESHSNSLAACVADTLKA